MGRLVAACLAIVLGVGFGSLAMIVHASASHGVNETIGAQYKGVDTVVYPDQVAISPADIAKVQKLPQAAAVVTLTTTYMDVAFPDLVRGANVAIDALYDTQQIAGPGTSSGRLPTATNEIALPARIAAKHKIGVGQSLRISSYDDKSWTVTVVGLLDDSKYVGSASAVATPAAVKIFDPGAYTRGIALAAKPGVTQQQLADAAQAVVPSGLTAFTGEAFIQHEVQGLTNGIDVLGGVFGMFAVIALFVACLVIGNTFTIVIAQRTREMALLRCVGASRRQVFSSVIAEATVVGVIASAIGVVFGVALSALGLALSREFDWGMPPVDRCTWTCRRSSCRCCSARSPRSSRPSYRRGGRRRWLRWPHSARRQLRRPRPRPAYCGWSWASCSSPAAACCWRSGRCSTRYSSVSRAARSRSSASWRSARCSSRRWSG